MAKTNFVQCPVCGNDNHCVLKQEGIIMKCKYCKSRMKVTTKIKGHKMYINEVTEYISRKSSDDQGLKILTS